MTKAEYVKLFNDLGKVFHGYDPKVGDDDVKVRGNHLSVRMKLGKFGWMHLDLDRRSFDQSMAGLVRTMKRVPLADLAALRAAEVPDEEPPS